MLSQRFRHFMKRAFCLIAIISILFNISVVASNGKVIYNFTGGNDGGDPATPLTFDSFGNAYGTTVTGGDFGCGTVFQLTPVGSGWQQSTIYSFTCGADGKNPYGGVALAGNLFGTTVAGGSGGACAGDGCGTVFELTKSGDTWIESVLYNFTGGNDGFGPSSAVVSDGRNLYGTTPDGGLYSMGVVYELSPTNNGWTQTVIHAFTGGLDGGVGSLGALLYDQDEGTLYGVTEIGGAYGAGTAFELIPRAPEGWTFVTIHQFQGEPHAGFPYGGLIADGNGNLYGTTYFGGTLGMGTVFRLSQQNGRARETVLHSFTGGNDGSSPTSTLVFDAIGNLYGTASNGGNPSCGCGTIFEISPTGHGVKETTLHSFAGAPDGAYPNYGLTFFNQSLYGTTPVGGSHGSGMIFAFTP